MIRAYRGDNSPFTNFDYNKIGTSGRGGYGFWFTNNIQAAKYFGKHVRSFDLAYQNPKHVPREEFLAQAEDPNYHAFMAAQEGHDAVVIHNIQDGTNMATITCVWNADLIHFVPDDTAH